MNGNVKLSWDVHFQTQSKGQRVLRPEAAPEATRPQTGRIPRVSRLMALAIHFERLLRQDKVKNYAEIARLGRVTRARLTQIMNLLLLAPDIQEDLLFLPRTMKGRDVIKLADLQPIARVLSWTTQHKMWKNRKTQLWRTSLNRTSCSQLPGGEIHQ